MKITKTRPPVTIELTTEEIKKLQNILYPAKSWLMEDEADFEADLFCGLMDETGIKQRENLTK